MVGGLGQLVLYGRSQDTYFGESLNFFSNITNKIHNKFVIESYEHDYYIDECMKITNITSHRTYRNFEIQQIHWYKYGNASFTVNKYEELNNKYNNTKFVITTFSDMLEFKIEKGNQIISENLQEQNKKARQLCEKNRKIYKKNEKQKNDFFKNQRIEVEDLKKHNSWNSRHHKRFFRKK